MTDQEKTREELLQEVDDLRRRLAAADSQRQKLREQLERRTAALARAGKKFVDEKRDRRDAEQSFQQSESRFRSLVENTPDVIWEIDENDVLTYVSPKVKEMFGYEPEEILGKTPFELMAPNEARRVSDETKNLDESFAGLEATYLHKNGQPVVFETAGERIVDADGKTIGFRGISRDVTDRKKSDEKLRRSEETARALINASTESEFLIEPDGTIVTLNETAAARLGHTVEELLGKRGYDYMPRDVAQSRDASCREVLRSGRPLHIEDERAGIVFDSCIYPVFDSAGNVAQLAIYAQDISERKAAEEAAMKERKHLKHSLEASDRERRLIAYDIHDGLAQYLSGAIMQFQTFAQVPSEDPRTSAAAFEAGVGLLGQALTEARRLIGGVRPPILDEMGIVAAVEHLVSGIRSKGGPNIELDAKVEFRHLEPSIENTLFRIIQESLANACIHSDSDRVRLTLSQHDGQLRVEIRDWGIGFDLQKTRDGSFGLEGIRERARLLGGQTRIESKPGQGTRVLVELPLPEEA